ncbi:MAG: tripartite tricarboxylate transporter substrate binding protein [Betaproteobacteria bacterium]|nr:tripartite tricarboxylate transporter substrate binding protein [Betaproteobacteria bacterium]
MTTYKTQLIALAAGALAALTGSPALKAQNFPARPIRLVVPFAPGGSSDGIARVVVQKLSDGLGQPVVIENRPGVGGLLGAEGVAKAAPDGYTLLLASVSSFAVAPHLYTSPKLDPTRNFDAIAPVSSSPLTVIVRSELPVTTIADLVALAKAKPGVLNYGSAGVGTQVHLAAEIFKGLAGIQVVHVPFQGGAPTMTALLGGVLDYEFDVANTTVQQVRAKRVKVLAVTSAKRIPVLPEAPTLAESGFPGFDVTAWMGIVGPAGLQADVLARLNVQIGRAVSSAELAETFASQGTVPELASPSAFAEMIRREYVKWGAVVKQIGVKAD